MAKNTSPMSSHIEQSLHDLSNELSALGLKPMKLGGNNQPVEVCEALLSTAWRLITLVHSSALGLRENQHTSNREQLLLNENQSLSSKVTFLTSEIAERDDKLAQEKEIIRRLQEKVKKLHQTSQNQKQMISRLSSQKEKSERDLKHEISRLQAQCEFLRENIRKSSDVAFRHHTPLVEKPDRVIRSLSVTDEDKSSIECSSLLHSTINRLKSVNHILVGENLMLRDALRMVHSDVHHLLKTCKFTQFPDNPSTEASPLDDSIFRLPLAYCMSKLTNIRCDQVKKLHMELQTAEV